MLYTARIEQTCEYPNRMKYVPETDSFIEQPYKSLMYERSFRQPYGWIKETGTPPGDHLDIIVMTDADRKYSLGDEARVRIIGVFRRGDGDHKLVGVTQDRELSELSELTETEKEDLCRLYPRADAGEGWFGRECAEELIAAFMNKAAGNPDN